MIPFASLFATGFALGVLFTALAYPYVAYNLECQKMGYDGLDWTGKWCVEQQATARNSTPLGVARVNYYVGISGPLERRER